MADILYLVVPCYNEEQLFIFKKLRRICIGKIPVFISCDNKTQPDVM